MPMISVIDGVLQHAVAMVILFCDNWRLRLRGKLLETKLMLSGGDKEHAKVHHTPGCPDHSSAGSSSLVRFL